MNKILKNLIKLAIQLDLVGPIQCLWSQVKTVVSKFTRAKAIHCRINMIWNEEHCLSVGCSLSGLCNCHRWLEITRVTNDFGFLKYFTMSYFPPNNWVCITVSSILYLLASLWIEWT